MAAGGLGVAAVLVDGGQALPLPSSEERAAIGYLAVAVTAIAFAAWYSGDQRLGVERAGLFADLIPVSTLFCAMGMGTGSLDLVEAIGVLVVAGGVSFGVLAPPQPRGDSRALTIRTGREQAVDGVARDADAELVAAAGVEQVRAVAAQRAVSASSRGERPA
jgi:EamA-like transporter family